MRFDGFDWDAGNLAKCQKHGVSVGEIERALAHDPLVAPDLVHSIEERRWIAIGRSEGSRAVFVAFAMRERAGLTLIRPVSARYMHFKESKRHEQSAEDRSGDDQR